MSDSTRLIYGTFVVSVIVHVCVLFVFNVTDFFNFKNTKAKRIEVALRVKPPAQKPAAAIEQKIIPKKEQVYQPKEIERKEIFKGVMGQKPPKSPDNLKIFERSTDKVVKLNAVKKVSIDLINSEKINDPVYTSNKERIAALIKEKVSENYANSSREAGGIIYLSFTLSREGELLQVKIIEERSSSNEELRHLAVDSLRQVRFSSLAHDFNVPEIPFSIQITFTTGKEE